MPLQIKPPILADFHLERSDKTYGISDEPTTVTIRQATQSATERRAKLFSNIIREMSGEADSIRLIQQFSFEELKRIEVMLTLAGCNISDENGKSIFVFNKDGFITDEVAFNKAWGRLPTLVANEIHEKVLEVNVDWAPQGE